MDVSESTHLAETIQRAPRNQQRTEPSMSLEYRKARIRNRPRILNQWIVECALDDCTWREVIVGTDDAIDNGVRRHVRLELPDP